MQRRQGLRFFAGSDIVQAHVDYVGDLAAQAQNYDPRAALGEETEVPFNAGYSVMGKGGVRMLDVPLMLNTGLDTDTDGEGPDTDTDGPEVGSIWLTDPKNLVWGVRREVEVFSQFAQKKDTIEYTVYTRVAAAVEEVGAFVVATNVGITAAPAPTAGT